MDSIEARLKNPCGYRSRERLRHSRSAKEKQVEEQFKLFKYEYSNVTRPKKEELYNVPTNLDLKFPIKLPTNAFKNKKRNYESLQIYTKAFDTLANQNHIAPTGNFTLETRKYIFDSLANSSIRLLCVMYDEQKTHPKHLKPKLIDFDKQLEAPTDFTKLYAQDLLVLNGFEKFFQKLGNVIPYSKKNKKKRKNLKIQHTTERNQKKNILSKNSKKKSPLKNKRKILKSAS